MINIYHYCGHIISNGDSGRFPLSNKELVQKSIDGHFQDKNISSCFGSLAAGADIMIANSMMAKSVELNTVLPFPANIFLEKSVLPSGYQWLQQFEQLLDYSSSLTQIYFTEIFDENKSYALCSEVAMGLAILESFIQNNTHNIEQIALWDQQPTQACAGTYPDMLRWQSVGNTVNYLDTQDPQEIQIFYSAEQIDAQVLDLVIYIEGENKTIVINSLNQLNYFFENNKSSEEFCIDFNRQEFGTDNSLEKDSAITPRALGQLVFNYAANNSVNPNDAFLTKLLKLSIKTITAMDTNSFCLNADLLQLCNVIKVEATEAIIFYTGRILEATSNYCVKQFGNDQPSNVFSNIEYINDYKLMDHMTRYWAHALRRMSNQYRHLLKATDKTDGQIAVILLNSWLDWLVNKSPLLKFEDQFNPLITENQNQLNQQFNLMSQWVTHKNSTELPDNEVKALLSQPVFASVIIEELINKKEIPQASKSLKFALNKNPKNLRLRQLNGLLLSRVGELKEAESILVKLRKQIPDDDETIGILAGVIKKTWQKGDASCFSRWGRLYLNGWKLSKHKNTYLGINAASYCLWNNQVEKCQEIATHIINIYTHRRKVLLDMFDYQPKDLDYWDQATLAEAHLLAGNTNLAQKSYQQLFTSENNSNMPHEIAANQLKQHLCHDSIPSNTLLMRMVEKFTLS